MPSSPTRRSGAWPAATGGRPWKRPARGHQRLLWASTGTKNPAYSDVMYVEPLIGAHTVNTMPAATAAAFDDHGKPGKTLHAGRAPGAQGAEGPEGRWAST